jgi:hypothetical protein
MISVPVTLYIRKNLLCPLFLVVYKAAAATLTNHQTNMQAVTILAAFAATLAAVHG